MGININDWGIILSDEQVNESIKRYKTDLLKWAGDIDKNEILSFYEAITLYPDLSNRAKLFFIEEFKNLIIKSRIRTTEDVIKHKNSLLK